MTEILAIAIGGALGAVTRYLLGESITQWLGADFPWGILLVNVSGSLFIGILFVFFVEQHPTAAIWRSLLIVGFLGAFTTFSTFSLQTLALFETGRFLAALGYAIGTLVLCLSAVSIGVWLARQMSEQL